MCNRFVQSDRVVKPGERCVVKMRGPGGEWEMEYAAAVFSGAARADNRRYWIKHANAEEVTVPAVSRYGEKNKANGVQSWEDLAPGSTLEGLLLPQPAGKDYRLLKVVTTDGGAARTDLFGNDRTPIVNPPLPEVPHIVSEIPAPNAENPQQAPPQLELF